MKTVRYVHAADLHLDTPFVGITDGNPALAQALKDATFAALENLAVLCEKERPDFLLLAGDIYNQEERSIRAQLLLRDVCARLQRLDIPVFICHGNHDPLSSQFAAISWPENVTIFGADPTFASVRKDGDLLALVHGASHAGGHESRNLAQLFHRDPASDCFQVGLLHCNVDGAVVGDRYAPCSLADLRAAGLDAWALGHAHERRELCKYPYIAYSGNTQGLRSNETGPKGCYLVTAGFDEQCWNIDAEFIELAPIQWQKATVGVDDVATLNDLEELLAKAMQTAADSAQGCNGVILTILMSGHTTLDAELRKPEVIADLAAQMAVFTNASPPVWLRKIDVETAPLVDEAGNIERDDLVGEVARLASQLQADHAYLQRIGAKALTPLYGDRRIAALLGKPDEMELAALLFTAQKICLDLLEGR